MTEISTDGISSCKPWVFCQLAALCHPFGWAWIEHCTSASALWKQEIYVGKCIEMIFMRFALVRSYKGIKLHFWMLLLQWWLQKGRNYLTKKVTNSSGLPSIPGIPPFIMQIRKAGRPTCRLSWSITHVNKLRWAGFPEFHAAINAGQSHTRIIGWALASVAQCLECWPTRGRVLGLIPG